MTREKLVDLDNDWDSDDFELPSDGRKTDERGIGGAIRVRASKSGFHGDTAPSKRTELDGDWKTVDFASIDERTESPITSLIGASSVAHSPLQKTEPVEFPADSDAEQSSIDPAEHARHQAPLDTARPEESRSTIAVEATGGDIVGQPPIDAVESLLDTPDEADTEIDWLADEFESEETVDRSAKLELDDYLDPDDLDDFDASLRADGPRVAVSADRSEARRLLLARELARRHGWNKESEYAVLEEIVRPMRRIGMSLKRLDEIISEGITPEDLAAAHALRTVWRIHSMWVEPESRHRPYSKGTNFHLGTLSWSHAWRISKRLGCGVDEDEIEFSLERLRENWFERYCRRVNGFSSAFNVAESFARYLVETVAECDEDLPYWAEEHFVGQADLHDLYRDELDLPDEDGANWI